MQQLRSLAAAMQEVPPRTQAGTFTGASSGSPRADAPHANANAPHKVPLTDRLKTLQELKKLRLPGGYGLALRISGCFCSGGALSPTS